MSLPRERAPNSGRLKSSVSQRQRASGWHADPLADRLAAAGRIAERRRRAPTERLVSSTS